MTEQPVTVLKFGGAVLRDPALRMQALGAVSRLAARRPILVVPGGGAFADQVRVAQRAQGFSDDAAHWMAILAMNQVAHLIVDSLDRSRLVQQRADIVAAHQAGLVPVLAPYDWLRSHDGLPHSWDVTSDSIAAVIADAIGASDLILLKPVAGSLTALVDRAFATSCPPGLRVRIATPATLEAATAD